MKHKNSLAFRLTVMVLVLLLVTIGAMMFLTKFQMDAHFSQYLYNSSHMMGQARGMHGMMHGPAETVYLSSVHSSLFWLGFGMALLSALICFLMVREALRPLKDLTQAARSIKKGRYDQHVPVYFYDEVGLLRRLSMKWPAPSMKRKKEDGSFLQIWRMNCGPPLLSSAAILKA